MSPLSRERWLALSPHLDAALDVAIGERRSYLAKLRLTDPVLADDLEQLLARREGLTRDGFLAHGLVFESQDQGLAGQRIGAYTLRSLMGQGGMGSVWLADRSDGRFAGTAAVKLLNMSLIGGAGGERFTREGQILATLDHPNVARLLDAGVTAAAQPYLVLEHVDGAHIDQYCEAHGLGLSARLNLFRAVLDAVAHAHAQLIVHRDIKPSNVLVTGDGRVKLLDFGIAKLLDTAAPSAALTVEGGRALTPEYAAPEQMTGGPITTATDVYALGVLLYMLLGGRHPAGHGTTPADLVRATVDVDPPRLSSVVRDARSRRALRGDLDNIVARALKKNPSERYPSVESFAEDLRRYLADEPVSARPDTLAYRGAKFVRRHTVGVAAAAALLVLAAGLVVFHTTRVTAERDRAVHEARKAEAISGLLERLLTEADPFSQRTSTEPTVRAVLEAGAARIEQELDGQPALQAELMSVMGRIYGRLGTFDRAQPLLDKALALHRQAGLDDQPGLAQVLNDLGVVRRETGDLAAAGPLLVEAVAIRRQVLGPGDPAVAVSLVELARVHADSGEPERAEPMLREALAIRRSTLGDAHQETATSLSELALLLWRRGDTDGAEPLFRDALAITRARLGEHHPDVATSVNNLGLIALDRADYSGAESSFREALALRRRTLGDAHPDLAPTLNNLCHALRFQDRYPEALAAVNEAIRIIEQSLGNQHASIATYWMNAGRVHVAAGDGLSAEPVLRAALALRQRDFPDSDWRVAAVRSLLGAALGLQRRYREAEDHLVSAVGVLTVTAGPAGREAAAARGFLAALYETQGRADLAAPYRK